MTVSACLSPADLERLIVGELPEGEAELLEKHVLECATCLEALKGVFSSRETGASIPSGETHSDAYASSPMVDHLIRRLAVLRSENTLNTQGYPAPVDVAAKTGPAIQPSGLTTGRLPLTSNADTEEFSSTHTAKDASLTDFLAPPQAADELGRLGKYRILKVLGHGGMGVVYLTEDIKLKRHVAVKAMLPTLAVSASARQRFLREAQAMAALEHDHIIRIYQVDEDRGVPYLAMEFLKGESLEERLKRNQKIPVAEVVRIGREIAEALAAAHATGLIHRDIKPGNIWLEERRLSSSLAKSEGDVINVSTTQPSDRQASRLSYEWRVKILDFGLARAADRDTNLTQQGSIVGTPAYMAPEQARGAAVDARCDLFSLGVVLYRLCTGKQPFVGGDAVSTLMEVALHEPTPPILLDLDLPPELSDLVMNLLEKDPALRLGSAADVVKALADLEKRPARLRESEASTAWKAAESLQPTDDRTAVMPVRPRAVAASRRRRWAPMFLAALALVGLLIGAWAAGLIRIPTDEGDYVIQTDDPTFSFSINGGQVLLKDHKSGRNYQMKVVRDDKAKGEFELELTDADADLSFKTKTFTVKRGERVALAAWFERKDAVAIKPTPAQKAELLYSLPWMDEQQRFPSHLWFTIISSDGRLFSAGGDVGPSGAIRVCDLATGRQVQSLVLGGEPWFFSSQFLPGGNQLVASYSQRNDIYLWDIGAGRVIRKFVGHNKPDPRFAISPDGRHLLSWSDDKTLRLWSVETGTELKKLEGHGDKAAGVFSPDGTQILSFSPDNTLRLWSVESGKEIAKLEGHTESPIGCFSPDGKQALSYSPDHTVRLWDLGTGKEIRRYEGPTDKVNFAGFVANGQRVVGNSADRKFRVWETATGALIREIDCDKYGGDYWSMTASPDGRLAMVNDAGGSVWLLDLNTGKEIHRFDHCPKARGFSFSPDRTTVIAGSFRAGVFAFRLPTLPADGGSAIRP